MKLFKNLLFRSFLIILFILRIFSIVEAQEEGISPEIIKNHIDFLASDKLQGRKTPSAGLDTAASYIAHELQNLGINSLNGTYFHSLNLCRCGLGKRQHFELNTPSGKVVVPLKTGYIPFQTIGDTTVEGVLVFAGYGLNLPNLGYDDYSNIDVKGKIVVVLSHFPGETSDDHRAKLIEKSGKTSINEKIATARNKGAIGLILLTNPKNHLLLKPQGHTWAALLKRAKEDSDPLILKFHKESFTAIHAGEETMKLLFGSKENLIKIQEKIDKNFQPYSFEIPGFTASIATSLHKRFIKADNVIGILEGNNPKLRSQYLIIGAHYDHIGTMKSEGTDNSDTIFNGADDNASGTAAVLAIARAFAKAEKLPERSVVFVFFAGEELGLLGSRSFVLDPPLPLDSIIAMLNFDMVCRGGSDTLYISPESTNSALYLMAKEKAMAEGFKTVQQNMISFGGSDHQPFLDKNIPALHFFTGLHADYHQVSDNPDRCDSVKASKVARLGWKLAWEIANSNITFANHYSEIKN
ncbi:MAG: M20/M25/M40 family metallo-hydrolase [Bacteroidales bacterium]|jgi:hypothetical protein|nr:M20/M25/M40 family metallo-hydrolase [Bacteroidales bacterium]MBP9511779.1 M20/M25/M40 family metallo-hydrolase [Bacteroidales bacterium]MBP9588804.1 M20/M25/M40 family metallo-hydrolase [Bacteroidales bacterium]MDI9574526.1 M20/M25/M40 family metallo-hydrolase [Bacteroidota bacterium]NMD15179.1 M20/M25/M40 family metallo-hydrolase [Bacteroidales bacterium]